MNRFAEALDTGQFHSGSVCSDCLMWIANGDDSGNSEDWDSHTADATLTTYDVTLGHMHSGDWDKRCWHFGRDCDDEPECYQECEQTTFSSAECSVCGSHLAGSRDDVIMIRRDYLNGSK